MLAGALPPSWRCRRVWPAGTLRSVPHHNAVRPGSNEGGNSRPLANFNSNGGASSGGASGDGASPNGDDASPNGGDASPNGDGASPNGGDGGASPNDDGASAPLPASDVPP